jgi:hypothetical protein
MHELTFDSPIVISLIVLAIAAIIELVRSLRDRLNP